MKIVYFYLRFFLYGFFLFTSASICLSAYEYMDVGTYYDNMEGEVAGAIDSGFIMMAIQFLVYSTGFVINITRWIMYRIFDVYGAFLYLFAWGLAILWIQIYYQYASNGQYDWIMGPGDSGVTIALMGATLVNFLKVVLVIYNYK